MYNDQDQNNSCENRNDLYEYEYHYRYDPHAGEPVPQPTPVKPRRRGLKITALVLCAVLLLGRQVFSWPGLEWLLLAAALTLPLSGVLTYGKPQALTFTDVCAMAAAGFAIPWACLLYTSPSPRD